MPTKTKNQQVPTQGSKGAPTGVIELEVFGVPWKLVAYKTVRLSIRFVREGKERRLHLDFKDSFGVPRAFSVPLGTRRTKKSQEGDVLLARRVAVASSAATLAVLAIAQTLL